MLKAGNIAPDFTLPDQNGKSHTLSSYKDKWIFLYFYPKDDTPGCTKEACDVRDNFSILKDKGVTVLGISTDSVKSHKKFEQKYSLPFPLLSDEEKVVVNLYKVWGEKSFMGKKYMGILRTSFLINPEGKIAKIYEKVKPETHIQEVLADMSNFGQEVL